MAYATQQDLIDRYDARTLGDLVKDDNSRETVTDLASNAVLEAMLSEASGKINTAILQGGRYTVEDLNSLTGDDAQFLTGLCCRIAFWFLWQRRPYSNREDSRRSEFENQYKESLQLLRSGTEILNIEKVQDAAHTIVDRIDQPEANKLNLVVDACRPRFYPVRRKTNK